MLLVYRFYRKVDKKNQVRFGDFINESEGLKQAVLDMPKNGGKGLRCWTCENAVSPDDCIKTGYSKQCRFGEKSCQTETRLSEGTNLLIKTGCKESHACTNNRIQNTRRAWHPTQCNSNIWNSVCRCCCQSWHCNKKNLLCTPPKPDAPKKILVICPDLGKLSHGKIICRETGKKVGTICEFQCIEEGYKLLPSDRTQVECIMDGNIARWSNRKPCCSSQCPPLAKKDVVIAMDSSRSIGKSEWIRMKTFIANVTGKFDVSSNGVRFAVYRFYRKVDEKSQVRFDDFINDSEGLKQAVLDLPKVGGGTYIGRALRHARDNVLTHQNRDDVKDLIWVLTDGKSEDDTEEVAQELRDAGVEILAMGIAQEGKDILKDDLLNIAGHEDNVFEVTNGIQSLTEDLVDRIVGKFCESSCQE